MPAETTYVLDASAVVAFLYEEPGAEHVAKLLEEAGPRRLLHVVNLCEIYYDTFRRKGELQANALEGILRRLGLEIHGHMPSELWRSAGKLKATLKRISLADCFALALTLQEEATLVTTDHHEFDPVAEAGICPIQFIR